MLGSTASLVCGDHVLGHAWNVAKCDLTLKPGFCSDVGTDAMPWSCSPLPLRNASPDDYPRTLRKTSWKQMGDNS